MLRITAAMAIAVAIGAHPRAQTFSTNLPPDTPANAPSLFWPGLDIAGRINAAFTNYCSTGKTAVSMSTTACNVGSVIGVWESKPDPDHPLICQMYCRLIGNRFEQINDWSFIKHSFGSTNSTECGLSGCDRSAPYNRLALNCSDTYGSTTNSNRNNLGPPWEINPFTGEWGMVGSHFDRGYPEVGSPFNTDGQQNVITPQHDTQFRCGIDDAVLGSPAALYFAQCYYIHKWEPPANRENNMSSLRVNIGATSTTASGAILYGTVLQRYPGARLESAHNVDAGGNVRDGRFYVAVHVTPLQDGWFHYEYAVHNRDNHGRNGTFRVPLCPGGWVRNAGFKDVDGDPTNDWTIARQGNVLTWDSPGGNAQPWNTIFNFWFDSDAAPENGAIEIVQAMPQVGAEPVLMIQSDVPTRQTNVFVAAGCGTLALWPNGIATLPSPQLALRLTGVASGASCGVLLSDALTLVSVPTACVFMVPDIGFALSATAVGSTATFPFAMPLDPGLEGVDLFLQGVELAVGGPLLDIADLSNVVRMRIGNATSGCP